MGNAHRSHHLRRPQFTSFGDACLTAGGAFCDDLEFCINIHWLTKTKHAIANATIHINIMEFTVVILQLAAIIAIIEETKLQTSIAAKFPNGISTLVKLLICTDNSSSQNWAQKSRRVQKNANKCSMCMQPF